jgi:hypothetical protein
MAGREAQLDALKGLLAVYLELLGVHEGTETVDWWDLCQRGIAPDAWESSLRDRWTVKANSARRVLVASGFRGGHPPIAWLTADTELPGWLEGPSGRSVDKTWRVRYYPLAPEKADHVKAIVREITAEIMLLECARHDPDDGGPFYKPAYFSRWAIGDELLRRNASDEKEYTEGRVRRQRKRPANGKGGRAVYWYSEPDARRRWPDRFAGVA